MLKIIVWIFYKACVLSINNHTCCLLLLVGVMQYPKLFQPGHIYSFCKPDYWSGIFTILNDVISPQVQPQSGVSGYWKCVKRETLKGAQEALGDFGSPFWVTRFSWMMT